MMMDHHDALGGHHLFFRLPCMSRRRFESHRKALVYQTQPRDNALLDRIVLECLRMEGGKRVHDSNQM